MATRGDMSMLRTHFTNLMDVNRKLIQDLNVRANQGERLQESLKEVKSMINKAGNLRCKKPFTEKKFKKFHSLN